MTIGIAGLGLIGGSLAKAYKAYEQAGGNTVYGFDIDEDILSFAKLSNAIDGVLDAETIPLCDGILIALNPKDAVAYLSKIAENISSQTLVMDCCGVKSYICNQCFPIAESYGFTFVGGHPMAGSHNTGFKHSRPTLFKGASMVIVPPVYNDIKLFGKIEDLLKPLEFVRLTVTTAEKHDEMISFTSQLAHVVSNAFIKSPTAVLHKGFSAGSYKDLTRIAKLNVNMWTELFLENREPLVNEIDILINELTKYRDAISQSDEGTLKSLLAEGSRIKEGLDGR